MERTEPRRVGRSHTRRDDLRDVAVDVVAEERRGLLRDHAETAVGQQTRLDQCLETVADTQNQAATVQQRVDLRHDILVVQHVDDELGTAVGFVTRGEAAAQHEDMRPADVLLHLGDRTQDVVAGDVAQHAHLHLGTGPAERLGRIVVAVRAREDRNVNQRVFDRLARIGEAPFG